jgi:RNA polymerase sigma-70 factor (ECF subfamily)
MEQSPEVPILDPELWVDEHGDYLYRFALVRVCDPDLAEELVQQALVTALAGKHLFGGRSSVRTWLTAILKRRIVDALRKSIRDKVHLDPRLEAANETLFTRLGGWRREPDEWCSDNPGREMHRAEFREALAGCLDKLPVRLRQVFVLTYLDEESPDAIRGSLGISAKNFAVMLHRARLRLWQCLTVNWFGEDVPMKSHVADSRI